MRRVFIGDIQGCLPQLDELLVALQPRSDDRLYCIGDLVNRGPDSLGVLRRVRELGMHAVLGNHDLHLLKLAAGTTRPSRWDRLRTILEAPDRAQLLAWLAALPVMIVEDDIVILHAGLHPSWRDLQTVASALNAAAGGHVGGHADVGVTFATEVRYCNADGARPPSDEPPPGPPFLPWDHFYRGPRMVVFGHWARRGLVVQPRLRGLDTGCVYGGALTAWIAEEDRLVQVPGWRARHPA
jgi:bis(5'-nucleosyl)-tetraphosphatase (symmetrical)